MNLKFIHTVKTDNEITIQIQRKKIKKRKKQTKRTRDIEIKNNVTIARGEWAGDSGERGLQELL